MKTGIITFIANRHWLNADSISSPKPASKFIPKWYSIADRFFKNEKDEYIIDTDGGKVPTWKSCPAILDGFTSGYTFVTPCDILFYLDQNNKIRIKIQDEKYDDFCVIRNKIDGFHNPKGYYEESFAWVSDWGISTPEGYSCIYLTPINRFDLPFINTTGIIDTDKVSLPGSLPFFLIDGWTGLLPAGTPYLQVIPFKRENWESSLKIDKAGDIYARIRESRKTFRIPNGGVYLNKFWEKREYK